jgi:hypothetical protein
MTLESRLADLQRFIAEEDWMRATSAAWVLLFDVQERNMNMSMSTGGGVDVRSAERQNLPRKSPLVRNLDWQVELARQNAVAQIEAAQRNQDSKIETPGKEPAMIQDYADVSAGVKA